MEVEVRSSSAISLQKNKDIIHVKQYGGSSVLSHLFSQAVVSADSFLNEPDFRVAVNNKLPTAEFRPDKPEDTPDPTNYNICIAIMSKVVGELELFFFSKVRLKHAVRSIQKMQFVVTLLKIDQ